MAENGGSLLNYQRFESASGHLKRSISLWRLLVLPVTCSSAVGESFTLKQKKLLWDRWIEAKWPFLFSKWKNKHNKTTTIKNYTHYVKIGLILSKRQIVGVLQRSLRHHYQKTSIFIILNIIIIIIQSSSSETVRRCGLGWLTAQTSHSHFARLSVGRHTCTT